MKQNFLLRLAILTALCVASINATATLTCPPGSCSNPNITLVSSENEDIVVAGKPNGFTDNMTNYLNIGSPNVMNYYPTRISYIFTQLTSISFTNVSLTNLVTNAVQNCGNLVTLSLSYNNFANIPASFAPKCVNLTSLMFNNNNIVTIDVNAFDGLKFLQQIFFQQNKIKCLPADVFRKLPIIQFIDFSFNDITYLDPSTFSKLPNLMHLGFMANKIAAIPNLDFTNTGLTMSLNIMFGDNPIMAMHQEFLTNFFTKRFGNSMMGMLNFMNGMNITSCFPANSMYTNPSYYNWPVANLMYEACYKNWKDEMAIIPCGSSVTTTTSAPTTGGGGGSVPWPWGNNKFFAILTNAVNNFTANVYFH